MNDPEKSEEGYKTIVGFFQQFGNDVYSQILLEELFKGLIDEETLFVFGGQVEEGGQTCDGSSEPMCDLHENDDIDDTGSADGVGATDPTDYL